MHSRACVVSPCCRHKPFGVTAILVRMPLMSVIIIFSMWGITGLLH